jgi:hypothetical protein
LEVQEKLGKFLRLINPASRKNILIQKGFAVGRTVENNARVAHYIDKIVKGGGAKGFSPGALGKFEDDLVLRSANSVKKYLFDYQDLSPFEQRVMKRFIPFYTWTRKNIPLQMETFITQPGKFVQAGRPLFANRDPQDLIRLKYTNRDLYDRFPIEVRRDVDTVTYMALEGFIPAGDLVKIKDQDTAILAMAEMLSPLPRYLVERSMGRKFYGRRDIGFTDIDDIDVRERLLGVKMSAEDKHLLTTVLPMARMVLFFDNLVKKKRDDLPEMTADEKTAAFLFTSLYKADLETLRKRALRKVYKAMREVESKRYYHEKMMDDAELGEEYRQMMYELKEIRRQIQNLELPPDIQMIFDTKKKGKQEIQEVVYPEF